MPPNRGFPRVALPPISLLGHAPLGRAPLGLSFQARSPVGGSRAPEDPRSLLRGVPSDLGDLFLPPPYLGFTGDPVNRSHPCGPRILRRPSLPSPFFKPSQPHYPSPVPHVSRPVLPFSARTFLQSLSHRSRSPTLSPSLHSPIAPLQNCHRPLLPSPPSLPLLALCLSSHLPNPHPPLQSPLAETPPFLAPCLFSPPLRASALAPVPAPRDVKAPFQLLFSLLPSVGRSVGEESPRWRERASPGPRKPTSLPSPGSGPSSPMRPGMETPPRRPPRSLPQKKCPP